MSTIKGANTLSSGYDVANSCMFNPGDNPELSRSTGDGNEDVGSFSFWWKPAKAPGGAIFYTVYVDSSNFFDINVDGGGNFQVRNKLSGSYNLNFESSATYRDPSAWYNFVVLVDTTQSTEANRMKAYVNGTQITSWQTATYPSQNTDMIMNSNSRTAYISHSGDRMHGYLAEFVLIDGTAQVVGDFGEFDSDSPTIWKPKDVSGLTKGTNGFYLDFEASDNLGNDANGGTDLTESGLAAADQSVDTPTNNFCVVNPLDNYHAGATLTEGNCLVAHPSAKYNYITSTFGVSKGKWYFEGKLTVSGGTAATIGIAAEPTTSASDHLGGDAQGISIYQTSNGTFIRTGGSNTTLGDSDVVANDIIGVFIDLDNNKIYGSVNGTLETTTGISITAAASQTHGLYFPAMGDYDGGQAYTWAMNFGGCPSFALSSAVSDDNGYGNFEYTPTVTVDSASTKFYALCTKNLAEYG